MIEEAEVMENGYELKIKTLCQCYACLCYTQSEKYSYSELFSSPFSHIRTGYGEIRGICPYSVRMREIADQNNSEYRHFLRINSHTCNPSER